MFAQNFAPTKEVVLANEQIGELRKDPKALDKENLPVTEETLARRRVIAVLEFYDEELARIFKSYAAADATAVSKRFVSHTPIASTSFCVAAYVSVSTASRFP